jgi:hypothetical protein
MAEMKRLIIPSVLFVLFVSSQTSACSCSGTSLRVKIDLMQGKRTTLSSAWVHEFPGAVFVGTVVKKQKVTFRHGNAFLPESKITFKVERYWRGVTSPEIVIYSSVPSNGSCGFPFKKHQKYIVFAEFIENRLSTNICGLTAEERYAPNMIKGLGLDQGQTLVAQTIPGFEWLRSRTCAYSGLARSVAFIRS